MNFGVCIGLGYTPPDERAQGKTPASFEEKVDWLVQGIDYLARTGYDYVEFGVQSVANLSEAEMDALIDGVERASIKPEAFNGFLPGNLKITGPDVDDAAVREYVERAIERCADLGGKVIVFGSGGARNVPDGFPREKAEEQIADFLRMAGAIASRNGVVIAVEPLNRRECNIINSVPEALEMAERADMLSVGVLADLYHMMEEDEEFENIIDVGSFLSHVHVADTDRKRPGSGSYDYEGFFTALKAIYYSGRISIEASLGDFEGDVTSSLPFMKRVWDEAPEPEED